jgi:hypothetical protein
VIVGDFTAAPDLSYRFIFVDTFHHENEIEINAPRLRRFLSEGAVLACHDTIPGSEAALRRHLPLGRAFQVDSLLVTEVTHA